jgi:MFS family permease
LWWASAVDNVGDGVFAAAVPLLAVRMTRSPVLVSAVSAATFLPWLLFSLPAGAMVDRYDRTRLMVRSQLAQAAVVAVTALLVALGGMSLDLLVVMAFALGGCEVVFGNAAQAMLPQVVPAGLLHRANGYLNSVTYIGQQFVGPPMGSVLFVVAAAAPFGLNAASFVGSAALIATLPRTVRPEVERPPMRTEIRDGLRWLAGHRLLRTLALLLGVNLFCFAMGTSTLVLLATRTLHVDTSGYGVLLAAAAVGGTIGGVVNARLLAWLGTLPALLASLTTTVLVFEAIGVAPDVGVLAALLAVSGFATTIWNVTAVSLRQQQVPDNLRGRVNSVYRMIGRGLMPLGALAGGLVAGTLGLRAPFPVAGAIRAVALLAALPILVTTMRVTRAER